MGHTCDATDTFCNAYIWENGVMTDLNTLVPAGVYLSYAGDINDRGEIAGVVGDPVTGVSGPAFLAIPCDEEHAHVEGCEGAHGAIFYRDTAKAESRIFAASHVSRETAWNRHGRALFHVKQIAERMNIEMN